MNRRRFLQLLGSLLALAAWLFYRPATAAPDTDCEPTPYGTDVPMTVPTVVGDRCEQPVFRPRLWLPIIQK